MTEPASPSPNIVGDVVRTLIASGFEVTGVQRHPNLAEVYCQLRSPLNVDIPYIIAIADSARFAEQDLDGLRRTAAADGRHLALICGEPGTGELDLETFFESYGGLVPSWKALAPEFRRLVEITSRNELPPGYKGEAWLLFEELVADALEFLTGRRVQRMGGHQRGRRVSDMIALTPSRDLVVVDAKASEKGFEATIGELRPLAEYIERQRTRQRGHFDVLTAIVVSSEFRQDAESMMRVSREFWAEHQCPVAFLEGAVLLEFVDAISGHVGIRNGLRWRLLLGGGLIRAEAVRTEIRHAESERYSQRSG